MADVGFFKRLGNLWRGFLSIWISDVEKEHPEIAYENAINSMIEKYSALKRATSSSAPGSSKRCVAPGTISSFFSARRPLEWGFSPLPFSWRS